jgi:hypothetical protein
MRRKTTSILVLVATGVLGSACTEDSSTDLDTSGSVYPTSFLIEPSYFLGDVPCTSVTGALQSYVATLLDVTDGSTMPFALPSSPPVSCAATITFRQVIAGHAYRLEVDGYDVPASSLVPLGGTASGSRTMLLESAPDAGAVTPPWSTYCDNLTARADERLVPSKCEPFAKLPATTGIVVDPRATLAGLACKSTTAGGGEVGNVASFDVVPADPAMPSLLNLPCVADGPAPSPYTQGITPGETYTFRIEARGEAGGPVVWGATCSGMAKDGLVTTAVCDPLSAEGAIDVSLEGLLEAAGATCSPESVISYDVNLVGPSVLSALTVPCEKPVRFSPVMPGSYAATIEAARKDASMNPVKATCSATVEPGGVAVAVCMPL